jgi:hypothetical protein
MTSLYMFDAASRVLSRAPVTTVHENIDTPILRIRCVCVCVFVCI